MRRLLSGVWDLLGNLAVFGDVGSDVRAGNKLSMNNESRVFGFQTIITSKLRELSQICTQ